MDINALAGALPTAGGTATATNGFDEIGSQEFFQLIMTDLLNQDPLEPMDNDKLLAQLSTIREMELNNNLSNSLSGLIDQQRLGSATSLLGQFVESSSDPLNSVSGVVTGIRFGDKGQPILQLGPDIELPLTDVHRVTSLDQMRASMIGTVVTANKPGANGVEEVRGTVTDIAVGLNELMLTLDSGVSVPRSAVLKFE